ncbi:YbgF trimerization domain-containing protein [Acinetobacter lwoffii]|uniref:YbgF trimerization domain-containing protein n=1 Tax=Acinetobacter lwoffii TaxID=28090 RepID=UPI00209AA907|nr:YbgF trimerization domain-containing protein [Acinetobacter lwoffii]MCO8063103.1 tetratricopeptide repeat protein [Acinetobacter lwoffii]
MMFKKTVLCVVTALFTTPLFANIPIESRGLSQATNQTAVNTPAAIAAGATPAVQTNTSWQIMQKNQQLENDLRILRGKMEEQENEIERLKNELTNRYADLDQRLELLQQKIEPAEDNPTEENPQDTAPSLSANKVNTASSGQQPAELEKAAYTVALDAYKNGGAAKAIAPMQNFIKNNPNSVYISNAYFWLAEFNLAIDPPKFAEAKRNYLIVVDRYPNSAKASTALYQLYNISKDVEKNVTLASQYKTKLLKNYPKAEEIKFLK